MRMHILILFCVSTYAESEKRNTHGFVTHIHTCMTSPSYRETRIFKYIYTKTTRTKNWRLFSSPFVSVFSFWPNKKFAIRCCFYLFPCVTRFFFSNAYHRSRAAFSISHHPSNILRPHIQPVSTTHIFRLLYFSCFSNFFFNFFFPVMVCVCIVADAEGCYKSMALVVHSGSVKRFQNSYCCCCSLVT